MKKSVILVLAATGLMFGCTLDEVVPIGERCPERSVDRYEEASLTYIGNPECTADNLSGCDLSGISYHNFGIYFKTKNCPLEINKCVQDSELEYHCEREKSIVKECAAGQIQCDRSDGVICLDPKDITTCGAHDCDDEEHNYGGQNCQKANTASICEQNSEGRYVCKSVGGLLLCDTEIDPSSEYYCGANDCNEDNYGGDDCSLYDDDRICAKDEATDAYRCLCRQGYIVCNGKCIRPMSDGEYCGAKGECNSDDPNDDNYRGVNCTDEGRCREGECKCYDDKLWCIVDGMNNDQLHCYSPEDNDTCNAKLADDGVHCKVSPCAERYACTDISATEYVCELDTCEDGEQRCGSGEDKQCYPWTDLNHCGACNVNCDVHNFQNVVPKACVKNGDNYACTYECVDGMVNCGSETAPECYDLNTTSKHCGGCGKDCSGSGYCEGGSCHESACLETECTKNDSDGHVQCVNEDDKCGKDCAICTNKHDNGYCLNGVCYISSCLENEHPIYNESGKITKCEKNTSSRCAPSNIKMGEPVVDCSQKLKDNVVETGCTSAGSCYITKCAPNYHISSDLQSCIANTKEKCGAVDSTETTNCTTIENSKQTQCNGGVCVVTECSAGYHINSGKTGCVANTDTACGAANSTSTTNCTTLANVANGYGKCTVSTGVCNVTKCNSGYHIKSGSTACESNSDTACGAENSTSTTNCTTLANVASGYGKCTVSTGVCSVTKCNSGYHLNSGKTGCVANTNTSCGAVDSSTVKDCTAISNVASGGGACSGGACTVTKCVSGYHLNSDKTGCSANSNTSCAEVSSNSPKNCTTISNVASGGGTCSNGACTVSKCVSGYHINSGKTACVVNSNTSCATPTSSSAKDCTSNSYEKECNSAGKCACSADGSTVLNYNKNACVTKWCAGIPGVKSGKKQTLNQWSEASNSEQGCKPTACVSGYKLDNVNSAYVCRPLTSNFDCTTLGYKNSSNASGFCLACSGNWSGCNNSQCASTHKYYGTACLPVEACCGNKSASVLSAEGLQCTNCLALGYSKCDTTTGTCKN